MNMFYLSNRSISHMKDKKIISLIKNEVEKRNCQELLIAPNMVYYLTTRFSKEYVGSLYTYINDSIVKLKPNQWDKEETI